MLNLSPSTVQARPYGRVPARNMEMVTIWTGADYALVNNPVSIFFPADGGVTVQGQYGSNTTVKATDPEAGVVAVAYSDGRIIADYTGALLL